MNGESYESALVAELQAIAGVPSGTDTFPIRVRAGTVTVVYKQWSTGPSDLKLEAPYDEFSRAAAGYRSPAAGASLMAPRPLDIQLRYEDREDRAAKADGTNVEWQTGDPAFDDVVYISTPGLEADVMRALLTSEVRAAVMSLFTLGFRLVAIDDRGMVRADVTEFVVAHPREGRGREALEAFTRLLMNLPMVAASGEGHAPVPFARATRVFAWTAGIFALLFFPLMVAPAIVSSPSPSGHPLAFAVFVGGPWVALALGIPGLLVAKKVHGGLVASRMRGSSRAAVTSQRAGWAAGLCALFVVATVLHATAIALFVVPD